MIWVNRKPGQAIVVIFLRVWLLNIHSLTHTSHAYMYINIRSSADRMCERLFSLAVTLIAAISHYYVCLCSRNRHPEDRKSRNEDISQYFFFYSVSVAAAVPFEYA